MSAPAWLAVAVLGSLGAVARFVVDGAVQRRAGSTFPIGTLVVNGSGAFLLGLLVGTGTGGDALVLAGGAALGSYTTFSTWMLETHRLAEDGELPLAAANLAVSLALGLAAAAAGWAIGAVL